MSNWDKSDPRGTEAIALGASRIREAKDALEVAMQVEHSWPGGIHAFAYGSTVPGYEGRWRYNPATLCIERYATDASGNAAWNPITRPQEIVAGIKMIFFQASAPAGWVQSIGNDSILRVVGPGYYSGSSSGGSWGPVTNSYSTTHTHTIAAETAYYSHGWTAGGALTNPTPKYISSINAHTVSHTHVLSTDTNSPHYHTIDSAWRPAYVDVMICEKS